jgi:hypothetical protein
MKTKIPAFTLLEFSISMTISTSIVGLLLLSFFYIGKWNVTYNKSLLQSEELYELLIILQQDNFNLTIVNCDSNELILENEFQKVSYHFENNIVCRTFLSVCDTFFLKEVSFNQKNTDVSGGLKESIELQLISLDSDTVICSLQKNNSFQMKLASKYAN